MNIHIKDWMYSKASFISIIISFEWDRNNFPFIF